MPTLSKNAIGITVLLLSYLGVDITAEALSEFISAVGTIVAFTLMIWNQVGREDVKFFFLKKESPTD